jgi:predicted DCC family thiol-disulfide oxidoreductase YuxK
VLLGKFMDIPKLKAGDNIIFYDGVCGLCNRLVQFVLKHGGADKFLFCSLQSDIAGELLEKYGQSNKDLDTIFLITDYDTPSSKLLDKAKAVFFIIKRCQAPAWSWLACFSILPEFILNLGYDLVASVRYPIFGRYDSCLIPPADVRHRFIDQ